MTTTAKHQILIVGGGTAGITVAARMLRKGYTDVAVIEPSSTHYYQPLWTLVGGGQAKASTTERAESSVMPKEATWIKNAASGRSTRTTTRSPAPTGRPMPTTCWWSARASSSTGTAPRDSRTPSAATGCRRTTGSTSRRAPGTSSATRDRAPRCSRMPSGPIKCAGAPQKIAYLASDYWRKQGVLNDIDVHLVVPTPRLFGIPAIADSLDAIVADYGITVHTNSEVTSVDAASRTRSTVTSVGQGGTDTMLPYDVLHAVPRQSAPDWIKSSPLSTGDANGYVDIDKHTMQHVRYPNVFSLGDAGSSPNSKTGAAIRKQAPVVVDNIDAFLKDQPLRAAVQRLRVVPDRHVVARDAAGRVRLRPELDAVDPPARPDQTAPRVLVPQEVRPAVHVLEPDAQGPRLVIRLRHNEKGHHNGNQESDL